MIVHQWLIGVSAALLMAALQVPVSAEECLNGIQWKEPSVIKPGENGGPPSDAVVLFDGTDFSAWDNADNRQIEGDAMVSGKGDIRTRNGPAGLGRAPSKETLFRPAQQIPVYQRTP